MNSEIGRALVIEENDLACGSTVELAFFHMELGCVHYVHVLVGDVAEMVMLQLL